MALTRFLHYYFLLTVIVCSAGLLDKLIRMVWLARSGHTRPAVALVDAPSPRPLWSAAGKFLLGPGIHFHQKSNRVWTYGYTLYHIAILLVVTGYMASALVLVIKAASGVSIPDFQQHVPAASGTSVPNILAFIFGNAEPFASRFLFGTFASYFLALAWLDLPFAVIGNACLLFTVLSRRVGAVRSDIDEAMRGIRLKGQFSGQHLMVRGMIFGIILMEFAGRMELIPGIAYYHAILGLTIIAVLPYTYLAHIPLAPLAMWLGIRRRQRNAVA